MKTFLLTVLLAVAFQVTASDPFGEDLYFTETKQRNSSNKIKCQNITFLNEQIEYVLSFQGNEGYPSSPTYVQFEDVPGYADCAYIQVVTNIEVMNDELIGTTSAGIQFLNPKTNLRLGNIKVLGREGYKNIFIDNTNTLLVPIDQHGKLHFEFYNLYPDETPDTVYTFVGIMVLGWAN